MSTRVLYTAAHRPAKPRDCTDCGNQMSLITYREGSRYRHDSGSEHYCEECGLRIGRWTGKALRHWEVEPPQGSWWGFPRITPMPIGDQKRRVLLEDHMLNTPGYELTIGDYALLNWHDEFAARGVSVPGIGYGKTVLEIHHIVGGNSREHHWANLISIPAPQHRWGTSNSTDAAFFVACCYVKLRKNELDWEVLHRLSGKSLPSWLETDKVIDNCRKLPDGERMRLELLGA